MRNGEGISRKIDIKKNCEGQAREEACSNNMTIEAVVIDRSDSEGEIKDLMSVEEKRSCRNDPRS